MKKRLVIVLLLVGVLASACGMEDTDPNQIGLIYSGGTFEDKEYKGLLKPGATAESVGIGSKVYKYRIDQRTYIFDGGWEAQRQLPVHQRSVDAPTLACVSNDNIGLFFPAQFYFTLNRDEKVLKQFHEKLGFKTKAYTDDGWVAMLDQYVRPTAERAAETACLDHKWRDLYTSEDARKEFARDVVTAFEQGLVDVVGGNYFCGPKYNGDNECDKFTLQVGKPIPPEKITQALTDTEAAKERTIAQQEENKRIASQVDGDKLLVELYGPYMAGILKAIESGKVQTFIIDENGRSSVPAQAG